MKEIKGPLTGITYQIREMGKCDTCGYVGKVMYCKVCKKWECIKDFSKGLIQND